MKKVLTLIDVVERISGNNLVIIRDGVTGAQLFDTPMDAKLVIERLEFYPENGKSNVVRISLDSYKQSIVIDIL